jgi:hypothetical protein
VCCSGDFISLEVWWYVSVSVCLRYAIHVARASRRAGLIFVCRLVMGSGGGVLWCMCVTMLCSVVVVTCLSFEMWESSDDVRVSGLCVFVRVSMVLVSCSGKSGLMCRVCSSG